MEKEKVIKKYEVELASIHEKKEAAIKKLHDALLGIGQSSVKDTSRAVMKFEDEARHIQICLDALNR